MNLPEAEYCDTCERRYAIGTFPPEAVKALGEAEVLLEVLERHGLVHPRHTAEDLAEHQRKLQRDEQYRRHLGELTAENERRRRWQEAELQRWRPTLPPPEEAERRRLQERIRELEAEAAERE
jgi:hypothetical protein